MSLGMHMTGLTNGTLVSGVMGATEKAQLERLSEQRTHIAASIARLDELIANSLPRPGSVCWASQSSRVFDDRLAELRRFIDDAHHILSDVLHMTVVSGG
jgi:hypothetical protein